MLVDAEAVSAVTPNPSPSPSPLISKALGSSTETWLDVQPDYDLAQVRKRENEVGVKRRKTPLASRLKYRRPMQLFLVNPAAVCSGDLCRNKFAALEP